MKKLQSALGDTASQLAYCDQINLRQASVLVIQSGAMQPRKGSENGHEQSHLFL